MSKWQEKVVYCQLHLESKLGAVDAILGSLGNGGSAVLVECWGNINVLPFDGGLAIINTANSVKRQNIRQQ